MVLLDIGTPGTSREIYSEDADGETRTLCTSRMRSQSQLRNDKYIMIIRELLEICQKIQLFNFYGAF